MESILIFAVVILGLSGAVLAVIFGAILSWDWNLIVVAASVASAISYCLNIFMIHRILRVPSNPSETQKLVIGTLNLMFSAPFGSRHGYPQQPGPCDADALSVRHLDDGIETGQLESR